ncbi:hypothetical protein TorRG33x02_068490, partial [Trema orientale]
TDSSVRKGAKDASPNVNNLSRCKIPTAMSVEQVCQQREIPDAMTNSVSKGSFA